jgi:GT2 family glycosyltransferase
MKKIPDVSIIVSNYNSSDLINSTLESIVSTAGEVPFEALVFDDASTDGGLALVDETYKKDARFTFLQNKKNVGYCGGLNIAGDRARGAYLMTLDTDARLLPGALRSLVAFMEAHPGAGAATANLSNPDGSTQNYYRRLMTPSAGFFTTVLGRFIDKYLLGLRNYKSYHYYDLDTTRIFELEQVPVACLILRREALGFRIVDPDFLHFGDVDLCRGIYDRGYKIYLVPDAKATHSKSAAFSKKPKAWKEHNYYDSLSLYFKKYYPASAPLMSALLWLDRVMRDILERTVGRAPMR